jgi:ribosomal protein S18 acetylase RimI-like enzyme
MVRIRAAEVGDVDEVARVWQAAWLDAHLGRVPDALMAERTDAYFRQTAGDLVDSTLVAVGDDGEVLGVVLVHDNELFQIGVEPAARRQGIGRALMDAAEARIAMEYDRAELGVLSTNTVGRRFYAQCGWTDLGEIVQPARAADLADEPVPVQAHLFSKDLR